MFFFFFIIQLPIGSIKDNLTKVYKLPRQKQLRYSHKSRVNLDEHKNIHYYYVVAAIN